jgi:hypothetical protein
MAAGARCQLSAEEIAYFHLDKLTCQTDVHVFDTAPADR